jgi:hypothetical protein
MGDIKVLKENLSCRTQDATTMASKLTYDKVSELFESKGCRLLTSREEFEDGKMHAKSRYKIVSKCGHENTAQYDMFKAMNCGMFCKACTKQNISSKLQTLDVSHNDVEYDGFCYIRTSIEDEFDVCKCVEGTKADFMVKPKHFLEDSWLPVQLKTTMQSNALHSHNYSFGVNKDYSGMLLLCCCVQDKHMWLFEGDEVVGMKRVAIGAKNSKYSVYQMDVPKLKAALSKHHHQGKYNKTHVVINTPISNKQCREQSYRRRREELLPKMHFEYPEREGLAYDFVVGGLKVQEKVATKKTEKRGYIVNLCRNKDTHIKKNTRYVIHDADYYWINIPDKEVFYLIPERVLVDMQIVSKSKDEESSRSFWQLQLYPDVPTHELQASKCKTIVLNSYIYAYADVAHATTLEDIVSEPVVENQANIPSETVTNHLRRRMAKAVGVKVNVYKKCGQHIGIYESISEAARQLNVKYATLQKWTQATTSPLYTIEILKE